MRAISAWLALFALSPACGVLGCESDTEFVATSDVALQAVAPGTAAVFDISVSADGSPTPRGAELAIVVDALGPAGAEVRVTVGCGASGAAAEYIGNNEHDSPLTGPVRLEIPEQFPISTDCTANVVSLSDSITAEIELHAVLTLRFNRRSSVDATVGIAPVR